MIDLTGKTFSMLQVLKITNEKTKHGSIKWLCKCDCGVEKVIDGAKLRNGRQLSCGCYGRSRLLTHGHSRHFLYKSWDMMISRCHNEKHNSYKNYGGRGITVCDEWKDCFLEYAMYMVTLGKRKGDSFQADRIDNNKGYRPGNIRLSTIGQNNYNRGPHKNSSTGYKGVSKSSHRFSANICFDNKRMFIGMFDDAVAAAKAYDERASHYFGEYAWLNRNYFEECK